MYYVVDDKGNKVEGLSKQEIYAVLQQAIDDGDLSHINADEAFVSKLLCCVGGGTFKVAFVTQAVYNQLRESSQLVSNALYFITDDETEVNLEALIAGLQTEVDGISGAGGSIENIVNGTTKIYLKDQNATGQELNMTTGVLKVGSEIISKKQLLYNGHTLIYDNDHNGVEIEVGENLSGKVIELYLSYDYNDGVYSSTNCIKLVVPTTSINLSPYGNISGIFMYIGASSLGGNIECTYYANDTKIKFIRKNGINLYVDKIYKIIE